MVEDAGHAIGKAEIGKAPCVEPVAKEDKKSFIDLKCKALEFAFRFAERSGAGSYVQIGGQVVQHTPVTPQYIVSIARVFEAFLEDSPDVS